MLALVAGSSAAQAQHFDLGLGGGARLGFTYVTLGSSGSGHAVWSPSLGLEASYTLGKERLRLSTGLYRGVLNQSVLLDVPDGPQNQEFTAYNFDWQVPLRLHLPVLPPTRRLTANVVTGLTLQRFGKLFTQYKGPYYAGANTLWRRFDYQEVHPFSMSALPPTNWLLEVGLEASLRIGSRAHFDMGALYQNGLRTVREFSVHDLPLRSVTRGNSLLLNGTLRYALKTWGGS